VFSIPGWRIEEPCQIASCPARQEAVKFIDIMAFDFAEAGAGEVGPRGGGMTFGYVRDLDGHKLAFYALP
jgi:hypothetical protein